MNDNAREKLATRTAYVILALLLVAALTVTVIAVVTTVSKRNEEPTPDSPPSGDELQPPPDQGNEGNNNGNTSPDTENRDDGENEGEGEKQPQAQVFVLPVNGYVSKEYCDDLLVFSTTMGDYRVHMGVDVAAEPGAPVYAFCEGTVKEIKNDPFMGKTVIISHANGIESRYMNLADQLPEGIKVGVNVPVGTVIGAVGETALSECADAAHLHFEVLLNGERVSPSGYVTFTTDVPTGGTVTEGE
ncbi:MAG: M23 family metallopeptidase [Clostridia bacterium]|nr:M23 family metallopeptidase [Clostridia bacterium]